MSARALAISVLARVRATDAYLNRVLDTQLEERAPADARDAGLVTELCYGATRRQLTLDYALAQFSDRKLEALEDRVLAALRVGAYQIFYTRVPRRAAVAETVEALREVGVERAVGFVNAVLRKVSTLDSPPLPLASEWAEHLSIRESHPRWLVERWLRQFGPARAEAMMVADNAPAPVVIRAQSERVSRDALLAQLAEAGVEASPTAVSPCGAVLPRTGKLEQLYGYREGLWQVQDEAAQLVGVFADFPFDTRVWDACAAPGGKACHLAEARPVLATDVQEGKLRKIESEARRLGVMGRMEIRAHDAAEPLPSEWGSFGGVLLDAPCSGLGTLRRHPELRYRLKESDVAERAVLQRRLLERCQQAVPPGGLLVYAVCSTDPQEGADQVEMFLRTHPEFTAEPPALAAAIALPTWQGHLRMLPGPEGWDGFFAARLRRMPE